MIPVTEVPAPALVLDESPTRAAAPAPVHSNPNTRVTLGASCTIQEAVALRSYLLAQAAQSGPLEIDGASVQVIDTAGVQLVVAFALDCLEKGVAYKWLSRSETLEKAIDLLGVGALLEYPA